MTANHSNVIKSVTSVHLPEQDKNDDHNCLLLHNNLHSRNNNFSNTPIIPSAKDEQDIRVVMENSEDNYQQDWIAEPDINQQKFINSEFQQLLTLNEELRQDNSDLYNQVERLKTELVEMEKILQWQKTRSTVTESMFNQQNQELSAANEQIQSLYQQLDQSVQTVQRQDMIIETYKSQLQISQNRLAQLERECSLLQTNYTEESQQLLHSENTCRELRTRLMRQQRQTLQFKAALEKCLDRPVVHEEIIEDPFPVAYNNNHKQTRFSRKAHSLINNPQPIQPWSVDGVELEHIIPNADSDEIREIPIYQAPQDVEIENQQGLNLPNDLIEEVAIALSQSELLPNAANANTSGNTNINTNIDPGINAKMNIEELEDYWLDSASLKEVSSNDDSIDSVLIEPVKENLSPQKSPSPLIYPQRPPKGRKSLASVELPNFRPKTE